MIRLVFLTTFIALFLGNPAQLSESESNDLVGSWHLISIEGHNTDGTVTYDWGREPVGLLMFGANGRLSFHLLKPERANFATGDFLRPTPEELSEAFLGYFGYFGTYTVDDDAKVVTIHIEGAAYPNYIGSNQRRFFSIDGDRLTLRTPPERAGGEDITYYVIWERDS